MKNETDIESNEIEPTDTELPEEVESPQKMKERYYPKGYNLHQLRNTTDRVMKDIPMPYDNIPTDEEFWVSKGVPNLDLIRDHLKNEGKFNPQHLYTLFELVYDVFSIEANIVYVPSPVTVCGDIHGQFYDLLKLFSVGGDPSTRNYLFLGDYVDRGDFSLECVILLSCYKVLYPETFYMLRGNHESRHLTDHFTFKSEVLAKYHDEEMYEIIMDVFDALPLVAIMDNQFFCTHAGISPDIETLDDIIKIDRFDEIPNSGIFCDLVWSDPTEDFNTAKKVTFLPNKTRGVSYSYGYSGVKEFLQKTGLLAIIRAHECQKNGYRMYKKGKESQFPVVISIFSAPNYASHYNNKAAVIMFEGTNMTIKQYSDSPTPYHLPDFQNVIAWSLPFVATKVNELVATFYDLINDVNAEEEEEQARITQEKLRSRILALGKLTSVYQKMKIEQEKKLLLSGLQNSKGEVPVSLKGKTAAEIKETLSIEEGVKEADAENESLPTIIKKKVPIRPRLSRSDGLEGSKFKNQVLQVNRTKPVPNLIFQHTI